MRPVLSSLVLSFAFSLIPFQALAQVPQKLSYQGLVTTQAGEAISDGSYRLTFRLYAEDGTEALYEETQTVAVTEGLFATMIGQEALLALPFDEPYFLTVEVEGEPESAPVPLSASPYALNVADGAVVRSISGLKDEVEIVAGEGIAIEQQENRLVISALAAPAAQVGLRGVGVADGGQPGESARKGPGGSNVGLDAAYDAGRIITADAGGVEIHGTSGSTPFKIFNGNLLFEDNTGGKPNMRFKTSGGVVGTQEWRFNLNSIGYLTLRDATGGANVLVLVPGAQENLLRLTGGEVQVKGALSRVDGQALEVKVGGARVMRYEPETATEGPNVIGGYAGNSVGPGVEGATIAGGGDPDLFGSGAHPNEVTADYGTVGGGLGNTASGQRATVGGGEGNTASAGDATVGGGEGNTASFNYATVGGGLGNTASGQRATVGGGEGNTASFNYATVGGGLGNTASTSATVGGGGNNDASGGDATVGGGFSNTASGTSATVGGGDSNTASDQYATVPGGRSNQAGGDYSFAAGRRAKVRDAAASGDSNGDEGTFVWADATNADFTSTGPDQFLVRAAGGVGIGTNAPTADLHVSATSSSAKPQLFLHETSTTSFARFRLRNDADTDYWDIAGGGADNAFLNFYKNGVGNLMTIRASGNVGIGTTAPTETLEVAGNVKANNVAVPSDGRYKHDVETITGALSQVAALRGVRYRWKQATYPEKHFEGGEHLGFIAQDLEEVLPEVVRAGTDGMLTVRYSQVIPVLVEALKEQQAIIDGQQTEMAAQQARIAALEAEQAERTALAQRVAALEALLAGSAGEAGPGRAGGRPD